MYLSVAEEVHHAHYEALWCGASVRATQKSLLSPFATTASNGGVFTRAGCVAGCCEWASDHDSLWREQPLFVNKSRSQLHPHGIRSSGFGRLGDNGHASIPWFAFKAALPNMFIV